jgi:hypothetical protein
MLQRAQRPVRGHVDFESVAAGDADEDGWLWIEIGALAASTVVSE